MTRRSNGIGTFKKAANGLICHRISLGFDAEGKRVRPTVYGKTNADCRDKMAIEIVNIQKRGGVKLPGGTTVATWLPAWLARKQSGISEATHLQYDSAIRNQICHDTLGIGRFPLDRLKIRDVDEWLRQLENAGIGGRARQYARMVLGNALNDAMRLEMIDRNVVSLVHIPAHETREFPIWDIDQALAFLAAAQNCRYAAFWTLWLTTGPRPHELLGLRPADVSAGEITLTKQLRKGGNERAKMKTPTSRRTLALTPIAIEALAAHKERLLAEGLRASEWLFPAAPMRNRAGKIVENQEPRATDYRNLIAEHYDVIVAAARYVDADGVERELPRIRPYDLRHTYATLALKAGVPVKVVSEALGHASIDITLRTYAHVMASMREEHVAKIQELFGQDRVTNRVTKSEISTLLSHSSND